MLSLVFQYPRAAIKLGHETKFIRYEVTIPELNAVKKPLLFMASFVTLLMVCGKPNHNHVPSLRASLLLFELFP